MVVIRGSGFCLWVLGLCVVVVCCECVFVVVFAAVCLRCVCDWVFVDAFVAVCL